MKRTVLTLVIILALLLFIGLLVIYPARAEVENVGTSCSIIVDNIVEGQPITITIQMYPAPPVGEVFSNLSVGIVSPMQGISGNGPWDQKNILTDSNGVAKIIFNIPTFGSQANWNVWVYFGGQYFANSTLYYQSGHWESNFFISPAQTPAPTEISILGPAELRSAGDGGTNVEILSIQNQSSLSNPVQLLFCVRALVLPYSFGNIGYSLDGGTIYNVSDFINETRIRGEADDVTVWAEVTLPKLSEGPHTVSVYYGYQFSGINQRYEVIAYSTANFLASSKSPTHSPSPTANPTQTPKDSSDFAEFLVPIAIVFVIVIALVLTFILKKKQQGRVKLTGTQSFL
jgi:hypothetical protein